MPLYEYECPVCGRFEIIQKFSDKELTLCPTCQENGKKSAVKRAVSAPAFHLKGSGWYKTDYTSSGSSSSSGSSTKSGAEGETSSTSESSGGTDTSDKTSTPAKGSCGSGCGCH